MRRGEDGGEGGYGGEVENAAGENGGFVDRGNSVGRGKGGVREDVLGWWGVGGSEVKSSEEKDSNWEEHDRVVLDRITMLAHTKGR